MRAQMERLKKELKEAGVTHRTFASGTVWIPDGEIAVAPHRSGFYVMTHDSIGRKRNFYRTKIEDILRVAKARKLVLDMRNQSR